MEVKYLILDSEFRELTERVLVCSFTSVTESETKSERVPQVTVYNTLK